jgi:glutamyl-tRNA synthetase
MKQIRTRFAPSPTGFSHVGNFRTAMYAWLHARHCGGKFLLRLEDTDQERLVPGAVRYIIESLQWLGVDIDEGPSHEELKAVNEYWEGAPNLGGPHGPYIQSRRTELYKKYAEELIAKGHAYRCDCTSEMLEKEREEQAAGKESIGYAGRCRTRDVPADVKHVVRFKIPEKVSLRLDDAVRGTVTWESPSLKDPVLLKSDGFPTYHLACVVDDHLMEISHVMRGEEWLSTTPLHLMLYDAFGWEKPVFCHLSQVLGGDGKKLSKRHGADSLNVLKENGYLPEAILNYVVLVGWSPGEGDAQEVFTRDELIKKFSLDHLNSAGGIFDGAKLLLLSLRVR